MKAPIHKLSCNSREEFLRKVPWTSHRSCDQQQRGTEGSLATIKSHKLEAVASRRLRSYYHYYYCLYIFFILIPTSITITIITIGPA